MEDYGTLHEDWLKRIDEALRRAIQRVEDEDAGKATVAVTITIGLTEEGDLAGTFVLKAGETQKTDFQPSRSAQLRLPTGDDGIESVTLSTGPRSVTLTKPRRDMVAS